VAKIPRAGVLSNLSCTPCVRITAAKEPWGGFVGSGGDPGWGQVGIQADPSGAAGGFKWGRGQSPVVPRPERRLGPNVLNESFRTPEDLNDSFKTFGRDSELSTVTRYDRE
jgi:hypothetical protein